jgi:hypothetical protein
MSSANSATATQDRTASAAAMETSLVYRVDVIPMLESVAHQVSFPTVDQAIAILSIGSRYLWVPL